MSIVLPQFALSIRQPWVHCILHFGKDIENRDWITRYRGPVCLHASKTMTQADWHDCLGVTQEVNEKTGHPLKGQIFPPYKQLVRGGIVGTAEIVDCVTASDSPWFFGKYGIVLANAQPVNFIEVKGALGFFDWRKNMEAAA